MSMNKIVGIVLLFIVSTLICTVGEMSWVGTEVAPLFIVINPIKYGASLWLTALGDVFLFRYAIFPGLWVLVRWIFLLPISVGFIISLGILLVQGIASALGGLFRLVGRRV